MSSASLKDNSSRASCACCCILASLGLFFGLLFGVLLPELRKESFVQTSCALRNSTIVPNYCCYQTCQGSCATLSTAQPSCSSRQAHLESLNPLTCSSPSCMGPMTCDGGYQCCATFCSTCTSCTTGSKGRRSCSTYPCNCFCTLSTDHLSCAISCNLCYTLVLTFSYNVMANNGTVIPTVLSVKTFYSTDLVSAQQGLLANEDYNAIYKCFYDPGNPTDVRLNNAISQGLVAAFIVCGLMPLLISITFLVLVVTDDETWKRYTVLFCCFVMGTYIVSMALFGIYKSYPYLYFAQAFLGVCLLLVVLKILYSYHWYGVPAPKSVSKKELSDHTSEEPASFVPQAQYAAPVTTAPVPIEGQNSLGYTPETDEENTQEAVCKNQTHLEANSEADANDIKGFRPETDLRKSLR